jgi:hypothetical protein
MEHLDSQLGAVAVDLSPEVMARIDEIVPPGTDMMPLPPTTRAKPPPLPPDQIIHRMRHPEESA